ncbi:RidA family protein [Amycolatopsis thermalba]|uniref:RidA family protein n=1 Tax=Amycolatopsis thermalba TaxID=944492 RepID=A0ABY4P2L4_9PSEU|nr:MULTISPECIES: RidA family protein [Amycolatopsis]UQS26600.1 RidA family protein [Amycolatopsis thermalba]
MTESEMPQYANPAGLFALPQVFSLSVTVPASRLVFLSGQVAWNAHGEPVGEGDHVAQVEQIVRNIDVALAAAGTSREHLVKHTIYVAGYRPELAEAILAPLHAGVTTRPASTLVGVQSLFDPRYLVEIDAVAWVP